MRLYEKLFKKKTFTFIFSILLTVVLVTSPALTTQGAESGTADKLSDASILYVGSPLAYVRGEEVLLDATKPEIELLQKNGIVFVPLRFIMDHSEASVKWDDSYSYVSITSGKKSAVLTLSSLRLTVNGVDSKYDFPVEKTYGKAFLPLRVIFEDVLDKKVSFYKGAIIITDKGKEISIEDEQSRLEEYIRAFNGEKVKIPVLMYHHFQENIPKNSFETMVTPKELEEQLSYLKSRGYRPVSFADLAEYIENGKKLPAKPFIVTIDDGYRSNYEYAWPILKKLDIKATISIVVSSVGQTPGLYPHFSWEEAKEMERSGFVEIQNHGYYHINHAELTDAEVVASVSVAQEEIDKHLGKRSLYVFTYPSGAHTENTKQIIKDLGFKIQLTTFDGMPDKQTDLSDIRRINISHQMSGKDIENIIEGLKGNYAH